LEKIGPKDRSAYRSSSRQGESDPKKKPKKGSRSWKNAAGEGGQLERRRGRQRGALKKKGPQKESRFEWKRSKLTGMRFGSIVDSRQSFLGEGGESIEGRRKARLKGRGERKR